MRDLSPGERYTLESLMDTHGINNVLIAIAEICGEKAVHIDSEWQDRTLARRWYKLGSTISIAITKATGL